MHYNWVWWSSSHNLFNHRFVCVPNIQGYEQLMKCSSTFSLLVYFIVFATSISFSNDKCLISIFSTDCQSFTFLSINSKNESNNKYERRIDSAIIGYTKGISEDHMQRVEAFVPKFKKVKNSVLVCAESCDTISCTLPYALITMRYWLKACVCTIPVIWISSSMDYCCTI